MSEPLFDITRWRLSTLFVVMTVICIITTGAARWGLRGAIVTLFASWIAILGGFCIYQGARHQPQASLVSVLMGLGFVVMAMLTFVMISS